MFKLQYKYKNFKMFRGNMVPGTFCCIYIELVDRDACFSWKSASQSQSKLDYSYFCDVYAFLEHTGWADVAQRGACKKSLGTHWAIRTKADGLDLMCDVASQCKGNKKE